MTEKKPIPVKLEDGTVIGEVLGQTFREVDGTFEVTMEIDSEVAKTLWDLGVDQYSIGFDGAQPVIPSE